VVVARKTAGKAFACAREKSFEVSVWGVFNAHIFPLHAVCLIKSRRAPLRHLIKTPPAWFLRAQINYKVRAFPEHLFRGDVAARDSHCCALDAL